MHFIFAWWIEDNSWSIDVEPHRRDWTGGGQDWGQHWIIESPLLDSKWIKFAISHSLRPEGMTTIYPHADSRTLNQTFKQRQVQERWQSEKWKLNRSLKIFWHFSSLGQMLATIAKFLRRIKAKRLRPSMKKKLVSKTRLVWLSGKNIFPQTATLATKPLIG